MERSLFPLLGCQLTTILLPANSIRSLFACLISQWDIALSSHINDQLLISLKPPKNCRPG